jgi:hypothetical protein
MKTWTFNDMVLQRLSYVKVGTAVSSRETVLRLITKGWQGGYACIFGPVSFLKRSMHVIRQAQSAVA